MTNTTFPRYEYDPTDVTEDGRVLWAGTSEPDTERRRLLARLLDRKKLELSDDEVAELHQRINDLSLPMIERRRHMREVAEMMRGEL